MFDKKNLISTTHSYNADVIVTDDQVKNALIKSYRNGKEQKKYPVTYDDILIKQSRSIIFPVKRVEFTSKFLLAKLYQYEINFD